jgi:hypothetical protein
MATLPEDELQRRLDSNPFARISNCLVAVGADDFPELRSRRFDEEYVAVRSWPCDPATPRPKTRLGTSSPRTCSICLRTATSSPPATFRNEAHVIPRMFGNEWLTTYDECDDCNARFGQHESELGHLTLAARAMTRNPARKATAKASLHGKSSVGGGPRGGALKIDLHADDPSVTMALAGPDRLVVGLKTPPFRPAHAAKALARIAWQSLPPERREEHEALRQWLDSSKVGAAVLYAVDLLDFRGLALGLWKLTDTALAMPSLVLGLAFNSKLLIWAAPDWASGRDLSVLFPLLPPAFPGAAPRVAKYAAEEDGVLSARTSFLISVGSASWNEVDHPVRVRIEFDTPSGAENIETVMTRRPMPAELAAQLDAREGSRLHELAGGELAGRLLVVQHEAEDSFAVLYGVAPDGPAPSGKMASFRCAFDALAFKIVLPGFGVFLDAGAAKAGGHPDADNES